MIKLLCFCVVTKIMNCFKHSVRERPAINFLNVTSNENFSFSIVLIRGEIINYNHRDGSASLNISNRETNECDEKQLEISTDGKFRIAVELTPGANLLKFQYCCVTNEVSLVLDARESLKYQLKVFYIICQNHDGCFQAPNQADNSLEVACAKIDLALRLAQCLYAEMLTKHGLKPKTFEFVPCQPFYSSLTIEEARKLNQDELWSFHAKEILMKETESQHQYKYFGVLASTICENGAIQGHAALGIGDVALFGSGTLYAWPSNFDSIEICFRNTRLVDKQQLMDDSNGRHTFGGCFATALGSICHEIGHLFDLGHSNDGIMGSDIDYVNRMFVIEKCPWELPRRIISKCSLNSEHSVVPEEPNNRITTVKKTNSILTKYHERRNDDLTFLTENCAILINYHKWFNQTDDNEFDIHFDSDRSAIVSSLPLALIEFRSIDSGMCIKYYRLDESNEHKFTVSSGIIQQNYVLIAVDKNGNIRRFAANELC